MPVQKILHTFSDEVLFEVAAESLKNALEKAVAMKMDLRGADLRGAYLEGADLRGADLRGAYLEDADLRGAYLEGADLDSADLDSADLRGADLRGAYLEGADLDSADLRGADLRGAYLRGADLDSEEIKRRANCPLSGEFVGWKKGSGGEIIKLQIPAFARRVSPITDRKCRAEFAIVLGIEDKRGKQISECTGHYDGKLKYQVGKFVKPDSYDASPLIECSHGIHFFITRQEAIDW